MWNLKVDLSECVCEKFKHKEGPCVTYTFQEENSNTDIITPNNEISL
jgi:hypothetical protein